MDATQIIGIGGLVFIAAVAFWLMSGGRKAKSTGEHRGEGPGEGTHGISSEAYRRAGESQPGGD